LIQNPTCQKNIGLHKVEKERKADLSGEFPPSVELPDCRREQDQGEEQRIELGLHRQTEELAGQYYEGGHQQGFADVLSPEVDFPVGGTGELVR